MQGKSKNRLGKHIIHHRGEMWPRNTTNIELIPSAEYDGGQGTYILFDGSTPVYVGRGNIRQRIKDSKASTRRGQSWDHFSWYGVPDEQDEQELEALLLRMLPPHLRILNRQRLSDCKIQNICLFSLLEGLSGLKRPGRGPGLFSLCENPGIFFIFLMMNGRVIKTREPPVGQRIKKGDGSGVSKPDSETKDEATPIPVEQSLKAHPRSRSVNAQAARRKSIFDSKHIARVAAIRCVRRDQLAISGPF